MKTYYQIGLDVEGKPCLIVGGGEEAVEKGERLLEAGASLTVVARKVDSQLETWAREGRIALERRAFRVADVEGVFLVQLCVKSDPELSALLYRLSLERRFLLGSWDQPEFSTYTMPALLRRGRLRMAISTGAASPSLAAALRHDLEAIFDDEFVEYLEWLAERRAAIEASEPDRARRSQLFRQGVQGFRLEGHVEYPEGYRESGEREAESGKAADA